MAARYAYECDVCGDQDYSEVLLPENAPCGGMWRGKLCSGGMVRIPLPKDMKKMMYGSPDDYGWS